jgi:hypothetical protein
MTFDQQVSKISQEQNDGSNLLDDEFHDYEHSLKYDW